MNKYNNGKDTGISNFIVKTDHGKEVKSELLDLVDPLSRLPFQDSRIIYDHDDFLENSKIKMFISGRGCNINASIALTISITVCIVERERLSDINQ